MCDLDKFRLFHGIKQGLVVIAGRWIYKIHAASVTAYENSLPSEAPHPMAA
jgi:hypothetical protein